MSVYTEHVSQRSRERYNVNLTELHQNFVGARIKSYKEASFIGRAQGSREEWQVFYKGIIFHVIWDRDEQAIVTLLPPADRKPVPRMLELLTKYGAH